MLGFFTQPRVHPLYSSNEDPSAATCLLRDEEVVCESSATSITFRYFNPIDDCDMQFYCGSIAGKHVN